jgi:hypothetical protein
MRRRSVVLSLSIEYNRRLHPSGDAVRWLFTYVERIYAMACPVAAVESNTVSVLDGAA